MAQPYLQRLNQPQLAPASYVPAQVPSAPAFIPISQVRKYTELNVRNEINRYNVEQLKIAMGAGQPIPPISVRRELDNSFSIIDGYHRTQAHQELGYGYICAVVYDDQMSDVQALAVSTQAGAGLAFTKDELAKAMCSAYTGGMPLSELPARFPGLKQGHDDFIKIYYNLADSLKPYAIDRIGKVAALQLARLPAAHQAAAYERIYQASDRTAAAKAEVRAYPRPPPTCSLPPQQMRQAVVQPPPQTQPPPQLPIQQVALAVMACIRVNLTAMGSPYSLEQIVQVLPSVVTQSQ